MSVYVLNKSPYNEDFLLHEGYALDRFDIAKIIKKHFEELFFVTPDITVDMRNMVAYAVDPVDPTDDFKTEYFIHEIKRVS